MTSLFDLQRKFFQCLIDKEPSNFIINEINTDQKLSSQQRLDIYRNSIAITFRKILADTYNICHSLVGEDFFNGMATIYIKQTPSRNPNLNFYGESFPTFIENFPHTTSIPYLADVARLEWAWLKAFYGENNTKVDFEKLQTIEKNVYDDIIFQLAKNSTLLESIYPLIEIWQLHKNESSENTFVDINSGGCKLIIWRDHMNMRIDKLSGDEWIFLNLISQNLAFSNICRIALDKYKINLLEILPTIIKKGFICNWTIN